MVTRKSILKCLIKRDFKQYFYGVVRDAAFNVPQNNDQNLIS